MYIITIVGAEACIGLAIVSLYYSVSKEMSLNSLTLTKL
jgi:NADH:ubiquinone oxidoreductase subunit K